MNERCPYTDDEIAMRVVATLPRSAPGVSKREIAKTLADADGIRVELDYSASRIWRKVKAICGEALKRAEHQHRWWWEPIGLQYAQVWGEFDQQQRERR